MHIKTAFSLNCSCTCSVAPYRSVSSLRASSPRLEQEKRLPLLGKAVPQLIFAFRGAQISVRLTSHSQSQSVGSLPNLITRLGRTPTTDGSAVGKASLWPGGAFVHSLTLRVMVAHCSSTLRGRFASGETTPRYRRRLSGSLNPTLFAPDIFS